MLLCIDFLKIIERMEASFFLDSFRPFLIKQKRTIKINSFNFFNQAKRTYKSHQAEKQKKQYRMSVFFYATSV